MVEKFAYKGHTYDEIKKMDIKQFMEIVPARIRRSLKRGFTDQQKILIKKVEKARKQLDAGKQPKVINTHCRDMVVLPIMVGLLIGVHDGREFVKVDITPEKLGHVLGEFTYNRKRVQHSAPGVGATRGSTFVPIK